MHIEYRNSIAYRLVLVAAGAFDAAIAISSKSEWDLAAADVIANEAGARIGDATGKPFLYNQPHIRQGGVICAGPLLHPLLLQKLDAVREENNRP